MRSSGRSDDESKCGEEGNGDAGLGFHTSRALGLQCSVSRIFGIFLLEKIDLLLGFFLFCFVLIVIILNADEADFIATIDDPPRSGHSPGKFDQFYCNLAQFWINNDFFGGINSQPK